MQFPFIRCYRPGIPIPPHSFFLLSKGDNAGRPSSEPWANSFLVICPHDGYYDFYYWLCYGLWNAGRFKVRHRGSVIPFINLPDVYDIIREAAPAIHANWQRYKEILSMLERLDKYKTTLTEQILATQNLQHVLLQKYLGGTQK